MASVMFPLFMPAGHQPDKLLRAQVAIILFAAAYLAEVVRGGLQALPKGQYEAADALGLCYWQKTGLIILPQALRLVIPPLVNTFIGFFKDTSLVLIIGIFDLLTAGKVALERAGLGGLRTEVYLVLARDLFRVLLRHGALQPRAGARVQPQPRGAESGESHEPDSAAISGRDADPAEPAGHRAGQGQQVVRRDARAARREHDGRAEGARGGVRAVRLRQVAP